MSTTHTTRFSVQAKGSRSKPAPSLRKQRLTFTLSGEAVDYIRSLKAQAKSSSLSATVEQLIEARSVHKSARL